MRHATLLFSLTFLLPTFVEAQTPTLVQHASCPNSRNTGNPQSNTPDYKCPLPEPSQAGNSIIVGIVSSNGTFILSDDKGNSYSLVQSIGDSLGQSMTSIYYAQNVAAGTRMVNLHRISSTEGVAISVSEFYNAGAVDSHSCNNLNSTSITAGSLAPTQTGDLVWQWVTNNGGGSVPNSVSSFTAGSQPNVTWQLLGTDLFDGDATQYGVYNSTIAINPTFKSGTSQAFSSCAVALKAVSAGSAPTATFRIVHMLHQQHPQGAANPYAVQFPTSGNLIVNSYVGGGDSITGITTNPSNTWLSTGTFAGSEAITAGSQIYYAANATPANNMALSITRSASAKDGTFMLYDIVGAAASPFDKDSGGQTANQTSLVTAFTTCSSCLTPSSSNELIIANQGQNWCTSMSSPSPAGSLFDAATDTGNSVDGPQLVDQNNGWLHYYDTNTNPITVTWTNTCDAAEGEWAGRVAAFKSGGLIPQQPAPPTQLKAVVN